MKRLPAFLALALAVGSGPARAADLPPLTISAGAPRATWHGSRFQNASTPLPEACAHPDLCDRFTLRVRLGAGYWDGYPGAVQVAIDWHGEDEASSSAEYDAFELYVYAPDGSLAASSGGAPTSAQALDLPGAADGDYTVVVVPTNVADRDYHGVAMVQSYVPPRPSGPLLPNLTALQPSAFRIAIGTYSFTRLGTDAVSCYAEETAQDPTHPTRCLRFDAGHANVGEGPFLLDINLSTAEPVVGADGLAALAGAVTQVVRLAEGGESRRPAGTYRFHPNHGHIHYEGFAQYDLHSVLPDGSRGPLVSPSRKADFCMIDSEDVWFGLAGNGPREHRFPHCNLADRLDGEDLYQRQGINRGWADIYTWDLPGQYIDITGVPDGVYDVVNTANPAGLLAETTAGDDAAATRIRLAGDTVTCVPAPYGCPPGTTPGP